MAQVRAPMPPSRRAKQFSMFDALKGLKEALAEQERQPEPRRYLSEDSIAEINRQLIELRKGKMVTVLYYCMYRHETCQVTGTVMKVDPYWKTLQLDNMCISFEEIYEVSIISQQ